MRFDRRWVLGAALALAPGQWAFADVITFGDQAVDELSLAGPQTEGGFRYTATGVAWELVADAGFPELGNPPAALATVFNGDGPTVGDAVDVTAVGGGLFTFGSVDFRTRSEAAGHDVTLRGFAGGVPAGVLTLADSASTFQTVPSGFAAPIDRLRVEFTGPPGGEALFLDNLNVTPIPEPAAALPAALALPIVLTRRRRRHT